ncbi:hypothetical protein MGN70_009740 [Eutypa lata]|uniref:Putative gpi anchored protein n=1 Tax=Eutypa lata (strain UCR-EL1) TaxID=1287681 RepID=M7SMH5_EUTLA|nr:putative gpi anchored protein [Eutypa lata UCREL1]KAI1248541.1 hypothetical protein MGN70_009740 [Eutypa lata]
MTLAASLLSPVANAHFTLTTPAPIGTDIGGERATPCGGFDPYDRSNVTEWPVDGIDVAWDSTNATAGWELSAVLVNGTDANADTDFSSKFNLRTLYTSTVGPFCLAKVRGVAEWVGEDAVLQVRQWVGNGNYLYACSAIKFVNTEAPASTCNANPGKMFRA